MHAEGVHQLNTLFVCPKIRVLQAVLCKSKTIAYVKFTNGGILLYRILKAFSEEIPIFVVPNP